MPTTDISRMQVVRREEKEQRLKDCIEQELQLAAPVAGASATRCMLLARSANSPVVRALAAFSAELSVRRVAVRIVFGAQEAGEAEPEAHISALLGNCEVRRISDPRLSDAHESLVLGAEATWIGDSMRRDPTKRDANEAYCAASPALTERTARSFARMWDLAAPTPALTLPEGIVEPVIAEAQAAAALENTATTTPGTTRH